MKASFPSCAVSDHFVDANKMVQTPNEPSSRPQENGRFANSNSIEFDGIKKHPNLSPQAMSKAKTSTIKVNGTNVTVLAAKDGDYISLTDMLRAKDGDFFISDWLRNRNTVEFLGIWETVFNPAFNYGEFAIIKSQAGLNSYKISVKEWVEKTNAIGLRATAGRYGGTRS